MGVVCVRDLFCRTAFGKSDCAHRMADYGRRLFYDTKLEDACAMMAEELKYIHMRDSDLK